MPADRPIGPVVEGWTPPPRPGEGPLQGRYVRLERLDADAHGAGLFEAFGADDAIWDYMPEGPFPTFEAHMAWLEGCALSKDPHFWAVRDFDVGPEEDINGLLSHLRISPESGSIEVGYITFSPKLQRTRAATEAVYLTMKWAFEQGYRRFEWKCNALNAPSRRAAQRFGFSYEGVFRQATISKGRNRDTAWFACIDKEWSVLRDAYEIWLDPSNFDESGRQRVRLGDLTAPILVAIDPSL